MGCELITAVDRSEIGNGPAGGTAGTAGTAGSGNAGTAGNTAGQAGSSGSAGQSGSSGTSGASGASGTGGSSGNSGTSGSGGSSGTSGTSGTSGSAGASGTGAMAGSAGTAGSGGNDQCGDGLVGNTEGCDDDNIADNDGCSASCGIEHGYQCMGAPSVCTSTCGDALLAANEACDDGNTNTADGCDSSCSIEVGFSCNGEPSICSPGCGDGILAGAETCDDNNLFDGDGCSSSCVIEMGFNCVGAPSVCMGICGDGFVLPSEACDDGNSSDADGCSAMCAIEAGYSCTGAPSVCDEICGDSQTVGNEQCDDGNLTSLDGCSATCNIDIFSENETNDTPATANGPIPYNSRIRGAITPSSDVDYWAIVVPVTSDLSLETFDENGPSSCIDVDTKISFVGTDGVTILATDDDSGPSTCSRLDRTTSVNLAGVAPGTYYAKIEAYNAQRAISGYELRVLFTATCGNGQVEGSEECDGDAGCDASCKRIPTCGDGFVDSPETCDDHNTQSGDGCSSTCTLEVLTESEANDTAPQANGPYAIPLAISASINPLADKDYFAISLSARTDLKIETFDSTGPNSCTNIDTVVTLYSTDGTTALIQRDMGGVNNCGAIDASKPTDSAAQALTAGTYYVRVEDFLNDTVIPGYQLRVTALATCGDGVVAGSEECDGGAGCDASCNRIPSCGDGFVDSPETCDDGNTTNGDGCSGNCTVEGFTEAEPNNSAATASGPLFPPMYANGSISPATDVDYYTFNLTAVSDVWIETFDSTGPGSCTYVDTVITLYGTDGTTVIVSKDDGGIKSCSRLDPAVDSAVRGLSPGAYYVKVEDYQNNNVISYGLNIRTMSTCGNGQIESSEQCDGGAGCDASCKRIPSCGDGFIDTPETCDDGNTNAGDGCSATCTVETAAEVEPNNTTAQADVAPILLSNGFFAGSIGAVGDKDFVKIVAPSDSVLWLETFGSAINTCSITTTLRLYDSGGAQLYSDDSGGIGGCSSLVVPVAAGTYYASVEERGNDATIAEYVLSLNMMTGTTPEAEPNEIRANATSLITKPIVALGDHVLNYDSDFYAINVPQGASVRAEVIEGNAAKTCESLGIDSRLSLYGPTGELLGSDDDAGRGFCSKIDGTGNTPANSFASALDAGTYYVRVEASNAAQPIGNSAGQFVYRLVITAR